MSLRSPHREMPELWARVNFLAAGQPESLFLLAAARPTASASPLDEFRNDCAPMNSTSFFLHRIVATCGYLTSGDPQSRSPC